MFAIATVAVFFLLFGDSREARITDYYKSIFGFTDKDIASMSFAVDHHGGLAANYIAYNRKLTKKMNAAYNIWTHLSPESKKFIQNFNDKLFDEVIYVGVSYLHKLKPYVESLSKEARQELCEIYTGFEAFFREFGKKCD